MPNHTVAQGESLSKIASLYGLSSWQRVYDHPNNKEFRKQRPDPNLLFPGDKLFVPDAEPGGSAVATDQLHRFRKTRQPRMFRAAFRDENGKPFANTPYKLVIGDVTLEGTLDESGRLEVEVPPDATEGELIVDEHVWPVKFDHLNPLEDSPDDGVSGTQQRLQNLGFYDGNIDGDRGPLTQEAIRRFQKQHNLKVDGISGPKTRQAIQKEHQS